MPRLAPRAGFDAEVMEAQARQAHTVVDAPRPARPAQDDPRLAPTSSPDVGPQITDSPPVASPPQVADPPKAAYASKIVYPPKVVPPEKAARTPRVAQTVKGARSPKTPTSRAQHPSRAAQSRRASASALRKARSPRQRLLPDIPVDGADPHQAFSRTGVCFAYFVNNACWRVRDAYCNTALHMCIIRNCPVYHLHKETLERRFARKFEHLW